MKNILVTGAAGQIGSELVPALRDKFGPDKVVAASHSTILPNDIILSGPTTTVDVTDYLDLEKTIIDFGIDRIFHMGSILSATAENRRESAHQVNINGTFNVLECAHNHSLDMVILPSSIAAFGVESPQNMTPNDTIQKPNTVYGISKVYGELLGNYYESKLGLDVRGLRLPGIISYKTEPTAGTTDYAIEMFHGAIKSNSYQCFLAADTMLPMMYMPDAIKALIQLSESAHGNLRHHADFNVHAMSFTPEGLAEGIKELNPKFEVAYNITPERQVIADSWPRSIDDSAARREWGWEPEFSFKELVRDMYLNLSDKLQP
jgi:threonine 3-dehydrogenase